MQRKGVGVDTLSSTGVVMIGCRELISIGGTVGAAKTYCVVGVGVSAGVGVAAK